MSKEISESKISSNSGDNLSMKKNDSSSFIEKEMADDTLTSFNDVYESYISEIEKKTKINRNILYLLVTFTIISFAIGKHQLLFSNLLTMIFPIKWTMEEYKKNDEDSNKMWVTFWLVFGVFVILDLFHKIVLYFVPFYFLIRTISLLYLYLPCFKGAITVYNEVVLEAFKYTCLKKKLVEGNDSSLLSELKKVIKTKKE